MPPVGGVGCTEVVSPGDAVPPREDLPVCFPEFGIVCVTAAGLFHSVTFSKNFPTMSLAGIPECF